jgi:hypothetical protein
LNGKPHGKGTYFFADNTRYEGEFHDGKRNGHGIFYYASGAKYEGEWAFNMKNGKGKETRKDMISGAETYYDGEWNEMKYDNGLV